MKKSIIFLTNFLLLIPFSCFAQNSGRLIKTADIRIRDPFIYADKENHTYYLYAQSANRAGSNFTGVEAYKSSELFKWSAPQPVLKIKENRGVIAVWAPEMHKYKGKYYLFVTLTFSKKIAADKPVKKSWPDMNVRGTHVFYADNPLGPFKPFQDKSFTPQNWMALDGTLFVEGDTPYMVFCHEWVQIIDGTIDYIRLKDDLSGTIGKPQLLFRASEAPGALKAPDKGKVTDGCFLYRSDKSAKLFMIWSTFIPGNGYCVMLTQSESGNIKGPWKKQEIIYKKNGGHGMLFRSFDGDLLMALHQPNTSEKERLHLFKIKDTGNKLIVEEELKE